MPGMPGVRRLHPDPTADCQSKKTVRVLSVSLVRLHMGYAEGFRGARRWTDQTRGPSHV